MSIAEFRKARLRFIIIDNTVKFVEDRDMEMDIWLKDVAKVPETLWDTLVRGYVLNETVVFYIGNEFRGVPENRTILVNVKTVCKRAHTVYKLTEFYIYNGVEVTEDKKSWNPKLLLTKYKISGEFVGTGDIYDLEFKTLYDSIMKLQALEKKQSTSSLTTYFESCDNLLRLLLAYCMGTNCAESPVNIEDLLSGFSQNLINFIILLDNLHISINTLLAYTFEEADKRIVEAKKIPLVKETEHSNH